MLLSEIRFEFVMVLLQMIQVFWDVMMCEEDHSAFKMPGTNQQMAQHYIPEELGLH
jgi:hypothetical protein